MNRKVAIVLVRDLLPLCYPSLQNGVLAQTTLAPSFLFFESVPMPPKKISTYKVTLTISDIFDDSHPEAINKVDIVTCMGHIGSPGPRVPTGEGVIRIMS